MNDAPLSAAQLHAITARAEATFTAQVEQLKLRLRALEIAAEVCVGAPSSVMQTAQLMYDFLAEPTKVTVKLEGEPQ